MSVALHREWPSYRTMWRWHFYAGILCLPLVIFLSMTGAIYLFKPQVEAYLDGPYDRLGNTDSPRPLSEQVRAVLDRHPEAKTVQVELPVDDRGATRVLLREGANNIKVYVHPSSLEILGARNEDAALMRQIRRLHGQLGIGTWGSYLVELIASWTIVLILTGVVLWWPRNTNSLGGVLYPRWNKGSRIWWRDIHSVIGIWVSFFAVFLIATGLPWAKFWGSYFQTLRGVSGLSSETQDWTVGGVMATVAAGRGSHEGHGGDSKADAAKEGSSAKASGRKGGRSGGAPIPRDLSGFDQALRVARSEALPAPVLLTPPTPGSQAWKVASETQNRPLRQTLSIDAATGEIQSREGFGDKHWIDRMVGIGIAAHEGQLFGIVNQAIGLMATLGLTALAASGLWMWWKRRSPGKLGVPEPLQHAPMAWGVWLIVMLLGIAMPLFGVSVACVGVLDRWLQSRRRRTETA
ncbi:MAG: PepSY-associated TM helix domain-containing protein [Pirellula sp.]